jgi:AraC-like DNA-binding protein
MPAVAESSAMFQEHYLLPSTRDGAIWPYARDYSKPRHFHAQLELLILVRGSAEIRVGRSQHVVHAGQLVWQLPGVEHAVVSVSSDCELRVLHVEPDLCAQVAHELGTCGRPSNAVRPGAGSFNGWAQELGALVCGRPVVDLARGDLDALMELCHATSADGSLSAEEMPTRLRRALSTAWLATRREHDSRRALSLVELGSCLLFDEPSVERTALCHALDVSEGYLSRRFQSELGISFAEQRARLRIARFVTHVTRDRWSYLDAALAAGFGSYSQLHRVFTRVVQESPRSYFSVATRNSRANRVTLS